MTRSVAPTRELKNSQLLELVEESGDVVLLVIVACIGCVFVFVLW